MAYPNPELIGALRETARRLRGGVYYAWGHHGGCNCGNLIQVVTNLSKEEILSYAHHGTGEWTEIAESYCGVTHAPHSLLMHKLELIGLTPVDIHNIEYLEDREVLEALPGGFRWLKKKPAGRRDRLPGSFCRRVGTPIVVVSGDFWIMISAEPLIVN